MNNAVNAAHLDHRPLIRTAPLALPAVRRFASARTILALMLREMSTRYGRSPGGYAWAVIEPVGMLAFMAIAFSLMLHTPSLGTSFVLFYASAFMPFHLYQQVSNAVARAIGFSRPLLFYPSVTFIDAILARFALNALTGAMVGLMVLSTILWATGTRTVVDIVPILAAYGLAALLALAVGVMNCLLSGLFPVWEHVWSIATRPLFLVSGIFFLYEDLPLPLQDILWFNPLFHVSGLMREGFYPMYVSGCASPVYVAGVAVVLLALGLLLLRRHHKAILNN